ncbi:MAG: carboxypeptidase regulatory-like domain-containing protein [Pyrinomonadaceae bacterium]
MHTFSVIIRRTLGFALALCLCAGLSAFAQTAQPGALRGQVADEFGGLLIGATVTLIDAKGAQQTVQTGDDGTYNFNSLAPGQYTLTVAAAGFAVFEKPDVTISPGKRLALDIKMSVTLGKEEVTVSAETPISTDAENNGSALVIKGTDLDSLPDDPDDLAAALQALAGPAAGPNGGQIFIDGFTGGRMPPKESIREIRINQNPFSAEFDRLGFGRIEILTKPGTDKMRGQTSFTFSDESLNSRNPYAPRRAPYQARGIEGNLSGPIVKRKSSFFIDFEKRDSDDNSIINAPFVTPVTFTDTRINRSLVVPRRSFTFSPRIDYQLNKTNTLVARYSFSRNRQSNQGTSESSLDVDPFFGINRTFSSKSTNQTFQVTETAILSPTVINETRFLFQHNHSESGGDISLPVVQVLGAFTGGGSSAGLARNTTNRFELQNYTTFTHGQHSLKAGMRIRGVRLSDFAERGFNGTIFFTGTNGLSSLDQFRAFAQGTPGVLPTQFNISGGNPLAGVTQYDFGPFIQDDWRVRPNFTLSAGLRYENQTNIHSAFNFAPRLSFAWSPGPAGRQPKTVLRGGFGVFYDRAGENLTLQANRFNGTNQQQFSILVRQLPFLCGASGAPTDGCATPDQVAAVEAQNVVARGILSQLRGILFAGQPLPSIDALIPFRSAQVTQHLDPDLEAPYTIQSTFSVERLLPGKVTATATYIHTRALHLLRSRNINAPLNGVRPQPTQGNIYEYESNGVLNQDQLVISANTRFSAKFSIFSNYTLSKTRSDSDGVGAFPADNYNLRQEYGRASIDVRHRFFFGGSYTLPWDIRINPLIIATSGRPFNITTGFDNNGDTQFFDRPALATAATDPNFLKVTPFGNFDLRPAAGTPLIPRNFGQYGGIFTVNLRFNKTFSFGAVKGAQSASNQGGNTPEGGNGGARGGRGGQGGGGGARGGGGPGGGGGGGGGPFGAGGVFAGGGGGGPRGGGGGGRADKRYSMTLSLNFNNLLNHTNPGLIVSNLSSPDFGRIISSGGAFGGGGGRCPNNRCVEAQVRFSF